MATISKAASAKMTGAGIDGQHHEALHGLKAKAAARGISFDDLVNLVAKHQDQIPAAVDLIKDIIGLIKKPAPPPAAKDAR